MIGRRISSPAATGAVTVSRPRGAALAGRDDVGFLEIGQHAPAGDGIALARLAQLERPRGPMQQLRADMVFKEGDCAADRGGRLAEPAPGAGEAALVEGSHEHFHRIDAVHHSSAKWHK